MDKFSGILNMFKDWKNSINDNIPFNLEENIRTSVITPPKNQDINEDLEFNKVLLELIDNSVIKDTDSPKSVLKAMFKEMIEAIETLKKEHQLGKYPGMDVATYIDNTEKLTDMMSHIINNTDLLCD